MIGKDWWCCPDDDNKNCDGKDCPIYLRDTEKEEGFKYYRICKNSKDSYNNPRFKFVTKEEYEASQVLKV